MLGKRKSSSKVAKPPVSRHPLFPAIVALWFGALFGLGSLAIRRSLLESIVIASQIDTIIPSAAPPLGITVRILLALAMAIVGAIIGGLFARMIARPAKIKPVRRRQAVKAEPAEERKPATFGQNVARSKPPVAADDEAALTPAPSRKRALTVMEYDISDHDVQRFGSDAAPLPGGPPEIFDVKSFDLSDSDSRQSIFDAADSEPAPLELNAFTAPYPGQADEPALINETAPSAFQPGADSRDHNRFDPPQQQVFAAPPVAAAPEEVLFSEAEPAMPLQSAQADFAPPIPVAYEPSAEPEMTEPQPYSAAPLNGANRFDEPVAVPAEAATPAFASAAEPITFVAPSAASSAQAEVVDPFEATFEPAAAFSNAPEEAAVEPLEMTEQLTENQADQARVNALDLAELSSPELVERLALSIKSRKAAFTAGAVAIPAAVSFAAPAAAPIALAPVPVPVPEDTAQARLTIPAALKPINFSDFEDDDDDDASDFLPQRRMVLPQTSVAQPVTAPFAVPVPFEAPAAVTENPPPEAITDSSESEADVAEENYSSLLDLSRPAQSRQGFVRIEESEADEEDYETVVVFPGQQTGQRFAEPAPSFDAAPQRLDLTPELLEQAMPAPVAEAPTLRFGAPQEAAESPVAVAPQALNGGAQAALDPAETERALRTALATLQRMTGAA